jgi:ParB-like chromosome segregation protein Spo0J
MVTTHTLPSNRLVEHPGNYNQHSPAQVEHLRASLRLFGQVQTVVVQAPANPRDGLFTIVAGHGLTQAAVLEGIAQLECRVIPADWPPAKVKAYLAADNELARKSERDNAQLASIVAEALAYDEKILQAIGFNDEEYQALLERIDGESKTATIRAVDAKPPPQMAWVLIGIPTVLYGRIDQLVQEASVIPDAIIETTLTDE